jgi:hypothetical protein
MNSLQSLGISEPTPAILSALLEKDNKSTRKWIETASKDPLLKEFPLPILMWCKLNCTFCDESEAFSEAMQPILGDDTPLVETARKIIWQGASSSDYDFLLGTIELLKEHRNVRLKEYDLNDCTTLDEMKRKISIYSKLANGSLENFMKGANLFDGNGYSISVTPGFYEHSGGVCLKLMSDDNNNKPLYHVGGRIDKLVTRILAIHGRENDTENVAAQTAAFRDTYNIHPANFLVLAYMKIGRLVGNERAIINSKASRVCNRQEKDSQLYTIPKYYFRIDVNPATGLYEIGKDKYDSLLQKFEAKTPELKRVFASLNILHLS